MRENLTYGLMWQGVETSTSARRHSLTLRADAPESPCDDVAAARGSFATFGGLDQMTVADQNPSRALSIARRIEMMADFRQHPSIRRAAEEAVPVTMPRDVGGLGFDVPVWMGLGIVGLWAALDAFHERAGLPQGSCPACGGSCIAIRFKSYADATDYSSLRELEDLRHLHAHNYSGETDDQFFAARRRHVLNRDAGAKLTCGAIFDGTRVGLEAEHLRFYAGVVQRVLGRFQ
jgi:hypothetical protein